MANICVIKRDPANKTLAIEVIDDASGSVVATAGRIVLDLSLLGSEAPATYQEMAVRGTKGCADDGSALYCYVLRTKWFTSPVPADLT